MCVCPLSSKALTHLVYMPYAYAVDKFKWDVFSSAVPEEDLNCHWVKLRMDVQGKLAVDKFIRCLSFGREPGLDCLRFGVLYLPA